MGTTLPLFWNLSSADKKERLNASVKLVGALEQFQAQFTPKETSSEDSEEDEGEEEPGASRTDTLGALNAPDVSYSVRRLVRGLASPRESSRLGFAVALTELLSRLNTVTCSQIITLILDSSKSQGSMSGQEERDMLFACLFGFTAVIQSGLLLRTQPLQSSSTPASDLTCYTSLLSELIVLGEKKAWLRESAWWAIGLAVDAVHASEIPWKEEAISATVSCIYEDETVHWSPEKVALTLKLQASSPDLQWKKLLAPTFKNADILSTGNLSALARIMKDSHQEDETEGKLASGSSGSWNPQIHYAWDDLLERLLPTDGIAKPQGTIQEFFRIVVDESLFAATSSPERKYWGFQVIQKALNRTSPGTIPMLFTKNFMRCWINHLSKDDRYLHKIALQAAKDLQKAVEKNPSIGVSVVLQLIGPHGSQNFDRLTKTKTVDSILSSMTAEGIQNYVEHLLEQASEPSSDGADESSLAARQGWIIDQLHVLVRNTSIPRSDEWITTVLHWLLVNGLFVVKKASPKSPFHAVRAPPAPPLSKPLQERCSARLMSCVADLTSRTTTSKADDEKTIKLTASASDGELWVTKVVDALTQLEKDAKHTAPLKVTDGGKVALRQQARDEITALRKVQKPAARGAELLLAATLLNAYCAEDMEDNNSSALESCIEAARRMFPSEPKSKSKKKGRLSVTAAPNDDDPPPIDVLIDTLIGFLEASAANLRAVANQVFGMLTGEVKESTIDLILTQLERRDPTADDEDEDMDDNEADSESPEEEEENKEEEEVEDEDYSDDGEDDEEEQAEAEEETDDEEVTELRRKLADALKTNGKEDADFEDDSDEVMDDEQMMAIDEQLAQIFKARRTDEKKKKDTGAQREATHFKNRVLDLVDVFLRTQSSSPLAVRCILPLLDLVTGTGSDEKQLADKAAGILRSRIGKNKDTPAGADRAALEDALRTVHTRARKTRSADTLATLSVCSLYLARALLHADGRDVVLEVYRESIVDYATRKNSELNGAFLQDFVSRHPVEAWILRSDILDVTEKAVNAYRQTQAYQLLATLFGRLPASSDLHDDLVEFVPRLRKAAIAAVAAACDEDTLSAAQLKDLLKLVLSAARFSKRLVDASELTLWEPSSWTALREKLVASERFKSSTGLHDLCRQMERLDSAADGQGTKPAKANGIDAKPKTKRKAEDAERAGKIADKSSRKKAKRV